MVKPSLPDPYAPPIPTGTGDSPSGDPSVPQSPATPPGPTPPPPSTPVSPTGQSTNSADFFSSGVFIINPNRPEFRNTFTIRELKDTRGRSLGVWEWTLTLANFTGGLFSAWGDFSSTPTRVGMPSTVATNHPGYAHLPYATSATTTTGWGNFRGVHTVTIGSSTALGIGDTASKSLYDLTSGINAVAFTPNGPITCVSKGILNSGAESFIIGSSAGVGEVLTDLTPTSAGDMHSDTNPMWGFLRTDLPSSSSFINLLYCKGSISTLLHTDAIATAPTVATAGVANGGFAVGTSSASGARRAYWVIPFTNNTTGILNTGTPGRLSSTNLEGTDMQTLEIPLAGVTQAIIYQDGIVYTNGNEVGWYRDRRNYDLGWNREQGFLQLSSAGLYKCRGFWNFRGRLRALAMEDPAAGSFDIVTQILEFNQEDWSWHPVSGRVSTVATQASIYPAGMGGLPLSVQDIGYYLFTNQTSTNTFESTYFGLAGVNPFFRQASAFASTGTLLTPIWTLPGLAGIPSVVSEVFCGGWLYSGHQSGAAGDSSITVTIPSGQGSYPLQNSTRTVVFREGDPAWKRRVFLADNTDAFTLFQASVLLTQDSSATLTSPNPLPLVFRGLAFPDGRVRPPSDFRTAAA